MKKIRKILLALAILTIGGKLFASPLEFNNSVGLYGMIDTDIMGLQYQRWFGKVGVQTQGFVYYDDDYWTDSENQKQGKYNYSLSSEVQLKFFEAPLGLRSASILYGWALAGIHGFNDTVWINESGTYGKSDYVPGKYSEPKNFTNAVLGIGFAFDIMFMNHISIPLQFGFTGEFPNKLKAGLTVGTGLRYRF